jgi:hypothetical protein
MDLGGGDGARDLGGGDGARDLGEGDGARDLGGVVDNKETPPEDSENMSETWQLLAHSSRTSSIFLGRDLERLDIDMVYNTFDEPDQIRLTAL